MNELVCLDNAIGGACARGHSCQNGATCLDMNNFHICICTPQWTGDLCDYPTGTIILIVNKIIKCYSKAPLATSVQALHVSMGEHVLSYQMVVSVLVALVHQTIRECFVRDLSVQSKFLSLFEELFSIIRQVQYQLLQITIV